MFEVPKGNGKTPLSAWIGLYELCNPNATSPLIPVAAASYDQADLLFGDLRTCAQESPTLKQVLEAFEGEVQIKHSPGKAYKVAAVAGTNDGQRPSVFLADETHEWEGNKARVHLVISNGTAKRKDSLILNTTTPGSDLNSLAGRMHEYGLKVNSGEVKDDEFLFVWYGCPEDKFDLDNPDELEMAVRYANPAAGAFLNVGDVCSRFYQMPRFEFCRYHLGIWTSVGESFLPDGSWANCQNEQIEITRGQDVVLGFDGSFSNDSTALTIATIGAVPHCSVVKAWEKPAESRHDWRVPVDDVENLIRETCKRYNVREIVCDPYRWGRTYQVLESESLPIVEYPQSPARMTPATTKFYEAVVNGNLTHDGNELLARHVANCMVKTDARGTRVSKDNKNSTRKIDAAVALIMAFDRATFLATQKPKPRVRIFNLSEAL